MSFIIITKYVGVASYYQVQITYTESWLLQNSTNKLLN